MTDHITGTKVLAGLAIGAATVEEQQLLDSLIRAEEEAAEALAEARARRASYELALGQDGRQS